MWQAYSALVFGVQVGLDIRAHVGPSQPHHILIPALVLGHIVHHAVYPVEEVVGWGVLPIEDLGSLVFGSLAEVILVQDGGGSGGPHREFIRGGVSISYYPQDHTEQPGV